MLVLYESPAGFALFQVLDEGKLEKVDDLWKEFESQESASKVVKLKAFTKFANTTDALAAATSIVDSKLSKSLRKFLKANCGKETLALADSKLGNVIKEKMGIDCVNNSAVMEVMRGLRLLAGELITGLAGFELAPMSLGLSHSLSRYKLKFSPDKIDTMIVQAIGLLDDLDKELNTYAMRVREWYGWHFPELAKIIQDNIQYAKVVKLTGSRTEAAKLDYSGILAEELEAAMKEAAVISMGTEVSEHDMLNIRALCDQVISLSEYRGQLFEYLRSRMTAIAPNLTVLVGELVGARLISHAGSLVNLAKHPASTVQILGAEKALFRALKTKHETPKYGLIYHASLIGQAAPKFKGKISRILAAKCALSTRLDALGDGSEATIGFENRLKVEARLRQLEGRAVATISGAGKSNAKLKSYDKDKKGGSNLVTAARSYNAGADSLLGVEPVDTARDEEAPPVKKQKKVREVEGTEQTPGKSEKKKGAKAQLQVDEVEAAAPVQTVVVETVPSTKEKKKSKKKRASLSGEEQSEPTPTAVEAEAEDVVKVSSKKEKKRKAADVVVTEEVKAQTATDASNGSIKKSKKKEKK